MHTIACMVLIAALTQNGQSPEQTLRNELVTYFKSDKAADRNKLAAIMEKKHSPAEVAALLPSLDLWEKLPTVGNWNVTLPSGTKPLAVYHLPQDYDGTKALPLVLILGGGGSNSANLIPAFPGALSESHGFVAISEAVGGTFRQEERAAADLPALLREIRRKIRIDTDRLYLAGIETGADASWMAALMYPSYFAGVLAAEGAPRLPYPEHALALLLPNVKDTPILAAWRSSDSSIASINRAIVQFARTAQLPVEGEAVETQIAGQAPWPAIKIQEFLTKIRKPRTEVSMWFRYLPQGDLGWLRATDPGGDAWDHEQISIALNAKEDRDRFITETLRMKLYYLRGTIEGQSIRIETRRTEGVEVSLTPHLMELNQAVAIEIDGRTRFEGVLTARVADILECAFESWDFQHPVFLRMRFSMQSR